MTQQIAEFAKSNPEVAREIFNQRIAAETNASRIADLEIAREYFCDPEFRVALSDHVYALGL